MGRFFDLIWYVNMKISSGYVSRIETEPIGVHHALETRHDMRHCNSVFSVVTSCTVTAALAHSSIASPESSSWSRKGEASHKGNAPA